MRVSLRHIAVLAALVEALQAQAPSQPAYTYEVVSIRRAAAGEMNSGFNPGPQGGMRARNVTAMQLLTFAYDAEDYQLTGVPGWARSDRFEISFTPDRSETVPGDDASIAVWNGWFTRQRQRLQAVLRDRFGLVMRAQTRELPIYGLIVVKNGHKLTAAAHPERGQTMNINGGRQIVGTTATMKALADSLSMVLRRTVRDETGLEGVYDFKVDWAPDSTLLPDQPPSGDPGGSIFTALTERLGLRLEPKRGPVPVYVVEKIERPSEN
jgi:bla regulator protein blaR1